MHYVRGTWPWIVQWAVTCSVNFSLAQLLQVMILLGTGGANGGGYLVSKYVVVGLHGAILFSHGLINCLPIHLMAYLGTLAAAWNVIGMLSWPPNFQKCEWNSIANFANQFTFFKINSNGRVTEACKRNYQESWIWLSDLSVLVIRSSLHSHVFSWSRFNPGLMWPTFAVL